MRINALTVDALFDGMATYVSCTYGATAYEEFNAVACNHGIRDCGEPAPMICETCGNGVSRGTDLRPVEVLRASAAAGSSSAVAPAAEAGSAEGGDEGEGEPV